LTLDAAKQALREEVAARVPPPGSRQQARASASAQERLVSSPLVRAAACVALYRSTRSECATDEAFAALAAAGKDVCFPAVVPRELVLRFVRPHGPARRGALGIDEFDGPAVGLDEIDLFVVPARAVDLGGHRLGRGKGHYDATLAAAGPGAARICLVFDAQVVREVPVGAHDQRMGAICTEARWIEVGA